MKEQVYAATYDKVYAIAKSNTAKDERGDAFGQILMDFIATLGEDIDDVTDFLAKKYFHDVQYDAIRNLVLDEGIRLDGRDYYSSPNLE